MTGLLPPWGSPEGECDDAGEDPAAQRIAGSVGPLGRRVFGFRAWASGSGGGVDRPIDRPTEGRVEGGGPTGRPTDRPEGTDRPTDRRDRPEGPASGRPEGPTGGTDRRDRPEGPTDRPTGGDRPTDRPEGTDRPTDRPILDEAKAVINAHSQRPPLYAAA
jgi:hypothetical protein